MPRIDPLQLLHCLQILLTRNGGIQSKDEVQRLANLMTKFSKKLVSKCIYILILKNSDPNLLDQFMADGGWNLVMIWLQEAMCNNNIPLLVELLELLTITPVNVERLKTNGIPKLVKNLTKRSESDVWQLATKLVNTWLKIVKDQAGQNATEQVQVKLVPVSENASSALNNDNDKASKTETVYKLSVRDGKQVISKLAASEDAKQVEKEAGEVSQVSEAKEERDKNEEDSKKYKSSKSSSSKSSNRDKERDRDRKDKDRRKSTSSKSSSSRDKDKSSSKDKDKSRHNGAIKSSSKSSSRDKKESKETQADKDKDTLSKLLPQSIQKLGRIPKKSSEDKDKQSTPKKEKNYSIEPKKPVEERPRTVKIFNAKMRSTGLEEEVKPPPPRASVKKPAVTLPSIPQKRPSPIRDVALPPEKKVKLEERPGAIKLIPPKPKPAVLQESDMFMDALTASASTKKEPKKRKRRASVSKESTSSPPPAEPAPISPTFKNITPPKFYQDTLEDKPESEKEPDDRSDEKEEQDVTPRASPVMRNEGGLKGVLVHAKKSGPKKTIQWKPEGELVEIQYFELDETERVNVTKNFMDMARLEMSGEREALQMSRKLPNEDLMDSQMNWHFPLLLDLPEPLAIPGCKSLEKDIQFAREKNILQALYFSKRMVPDSPAEPEPETHQMTDPVMIPLDDPENSTETDLRNTPWPEPKGSPPPEPTTPTIPHIFPNIQAPFPNFSNLGPPPTAFPNVPQFQGPPGAFGPPNMMPPGPGDWNALGNGPPMGPPNVPPPDMMNLGPMFSQENFNPMLNEGSFGPMHFNQQQNMFPPQNNFNMNRGRGAFRRGGGGPWMRMNGPGGWNRGGHRGGRLCKNVKNHGYCRNRDNCPFIHPN